MVVSVVTVENSISCNFTELPSLQESLPEYKENAPISAAIAHVAWERATERLR